MCTVRHMDGSGVTRETTVGVSSIEERFTDLYRDHGRMILVAAFRRVNNHATAQDVTAEVFRAAWTHRERAELVFTLPWLYQTLHNVVGNEFRRRTRSANLIERLASRYTPRPTHITDETLILRDALAELPPAEREIIAMVYLDQASREEAAAVLGCSVNAVNLRLQRARRRLTQRLSVPDPKP